MFGFKKAKSKKAKKQKQPSPYLALASGQQNFAGAFVAAYGH